MLIRSTEIMSIYTCIEYMWNFCGCVSTFIHEICSLIDGNDFTSLRSSGLLRKYFMILVLHLGLRKFFTSIISTVHFIFSNLLSNIIYIRLLNECQVKLWLFHSNKIFDLWIHSSKLYAWSESVSKNLGRGPMCGRSFVLRSEEV